jgi:hypothetical protein
MNESASPTHETKGSLAERNEAKRLENEAVRLKRGYLRGTLLPILTFTASVVACAFSVRYFCIKDTIFDRTGAPVDRDVYYDAMRDYADGNLEAAVTQATKILKKEPNHTPANDLMARIERCRGNREAALTHLRRCLTTTLNREKYLKWISALEASEAK